LDVAELCRGPNGAIGLSGNVIDLPPRPPLLVRVARAWTCSAVEHLTPAAERRAVEVLRSLAEHGQHRAPSIPDLLIAAVAETARLTVLHVDKDFDLIAGVTGQETHRLQ
jgi:predicted nucleic acid-binding protein